MIDELEMERVARWTGQRVTPEQFHAILENERTKLNTLASEALRSQTRDQRQDEIALGFAPISPATGSITRLSTPTKRGRR